MIKRKLTDDEISSILEPLKQCAIMYDERVKDAVLTPLLNQLTNDLKDEEICPAAIPELKKEIIRQVGGSFVESGEMVGLIAAQSIGQPVTQCTLSGFHKTGVVNITSTQGVPRINELFNASKEQKAVNSFVFLNPEFQKDIETVRLWAKGLEKITVEDIIDTVEVCIVRPTDDHEEWYEIFEQLYSTKHRTLKWYVRFTFDKTELWYHRVYLQTIANIIEEKYADAFVVWSPEWIGIMDVYVDMTDVDEDDEMEFFQQIVIPGIKSCVLSKFGGIRQAFVRRSFGEANELVVDTNGSNLSAVLALPEVDSTRTYSNDMWELLRVIGIEAVRQFLIDEIQGILNAEGTGVGRRHLTICADSMCWKGTLSSVSRYGLQKEHAGPMSNASFEMCLDNLLKGALADEEESTDAVSSGIMCGTVTKIGTGGIDLYYDGGLNKTKTVMAGDENDDLVEWIDDDDEEKDDGMDDDEFEEMMVDF